MGDFKRRVLDTLGHREPDQVPCDYWGTPEVDLKLMEYFAAYSPDGVREKLETDIRYIYASGIIFVLSIPYILMLNLPAQGYVTGNTLYYWTTLLFFICYLFFVIVAFRVVAGDRAFCQSRSIWFSTDRKSETD